MDEGKYRFQVTFPEPIELDRKWANLLLQGSVGFGTANDVPRFAGSFSAHVESLHVVEHRGESVVVQDTRIEIERDVLNSLVFCMSAFEQADKSPFDQYRDHWSFPEHLANEFGRRLGSLIYQQAKLSSFEDSILTTSAATATRLSLNVRNKRVIYRDRELVVTPDARPSFDELVGVLRDIAFVKPRKHSHEQEYRFVFDLVDGQRVFQPKVDRLLVNPNVLTGLE
jgi:hypothetical protein